MKDLSELRRLHEAATRGPWKFYRQTSGKNFAILWLGNDRDGFECVDMDRTEDAEFIAAIHNALPALMDELAAEKEKNKRLTEVVQGLVETHGKKEFWVLGRTSPETESPPPTKGAC